MCDDVDVVHVSGDGCGRLGLREFLVGFGEGGVKGERGGSGSERTAHRHASK